MSLNHSPLGGVNPLKIDEIADIWGIIMQNMVTNGWT
jgi:alanine-alpha-ketoisovalerate/valine-pyruvate aminotransferase